MHMICDFSLFKIQCCCYYLKRKLVWWEADLRIVIELMTSFKRTKTARYWKNGVIFVVDPHSKKPFQIHSGLR